MSLLLNLIWIVFGGFLIAIEYIIGGIGLCLTIVGIPFGIQCFKLSILGFVPFGRKAVPTGRAEGTIPLLLNLVWLLFGGLWLVLTHLILALFFTLTIVGIPFAAQHLKLAQLAFTPFGRRVEKT